MKKIYFLMIFIAGLNIDAVVASSDLNQTFDNTPFNLTRFKRLLIPSCEEINTAVQRQLIQDENLVISGEGLPLQIQGENFLLKTGLFDTHKEIKDIHYAHNVNDILGVRVCNGFVNEITRIFIRYQTAGNTILEKDQRQIKKHRFECYVDKILLTYPYNPQFPPLLMNDQTKETSRIASTINDPEVQNFDNMDASCPIIIPHYPGSLKESLGWTIYNTPGLVERLGGIKRIYRMLNNQDVFKLIFPTSIVEEQINLHEKELHEKEVEWQMITQELGNIDIN